MTNLEAIIYILVLAIVLSVVFVLIYRHKLYYHFREVDTGKLYCSGVLSPKALKSVFNKYGIKTVINLVSDKELMQDVRYKAEREFCENNGIKLINISLKRDQPPSNEQIEQFLGIACNRENHPLLVHCEAGIMRTNMIVALYMKRCMGIKGSDIVKKLQFFGHKIERHKRVTGFIHKHI